MQRIQRLFGKVPVWLSCLTGGVLCVILCLLVPGESYFSPAYNDYSLLDNLILFPFALAAVAALMFISCRFDRTPAADSRRNLWLMRILFLVVLGCQFIVARCCWYKVGWDVANVYTSAEELVRGLPFSDPDYFALCPNNAPLTLLQFIPLWFAVKIGLGVPFVVLPYVDAVLLNLAAYMCVRCVQLLTHSRTARIFALSLSIGWIALSAYILYPYSDTFTILFPVLVFYLWLRLKQPVLKWFLITLLCFFGASIKPTVLIVLIALIILGVCRFLSEGQFTKKAWLRSAAVIAAVILGMLPGKLWQDGSTAYLAGSPKPEGQLSATHYLMLGMNGDTFGGHSVDDVQFSQSYETLSERQSANLKRAWERLSSRDLWENIHFFATKAYKAYADGSFAAHGSFLEMEVPQRTDSLSVFLRSFYHRRGAFMPYAQTLLQCLWLGVLTLCACASFRLRKNPAVALLALTLLGLTAYLLLFEVWPRYMFLYAPFFVILSSLAFEKPLFSRR